VLVRCINDVLSSATKDPGRGRTSAIAVACLAHLSNYAAAVDVLVRSSAVETFSR